MGASKEDLRVIDAARRVALMQTGAAFDELQSSLAALDAYHAPKKPMSAEDRADLLEGQLADCEQGCPIGRRGHIREHLRAAESAAFGRGVDECSRHHIEYLAAYQMRLPVYFQSDVDVWKGGILQTLAESVKHIKAKCHETP